MLIKPCILVFLSLGAVLTAQITRNHDVPLKNWATPLYWQPSQPESVAARGILDPAVRPASPGTSTLPPALVFVAMTPCRVVDTRSGSGLPGQFGSPSLTPYPANSPRSFAIQLSANCSIPSNAQAYSFNVTVIPNPLGSAVGYLTLYPTAASPNTPPNIVTLDDYPTGDIRNNAAIVPAGISNGSISAVTGSPNPDLVLDINGYFAAPTDANSNTGLGLNALSSNTSGYSNTAVGASALSSNGSGAANTAAGYQALFSNTQGAGNTGFGSQTLYHNVSGSANTAVGDSALINNTDSNNTALGYAAMYANVSGTSNTATGMSALYNNNGGNDNTAIGYTALTSNMTGSDNTAIGSHALNNNTTGAFNTATGYSALYNNNGSGNTASGFQALTANVGGGANTAVGGSALQANVGGASNTAVGASALQANVSSNSNTAVGTLALASSTAGNNTATGSNALLFNFSGANNTGIGTNALQSNFAGSDNTALGYLAGFNTTGDNNILIGNPGAPSENNVIRIGKTQTSFFAAGISGAVPSAVPVLIGTNGQLGTANSSRRFKEDIQDMDDASSGLLRLRPVTYRYQHPYPDGSKPIDYGLIAEEVAEVYPDLVVKGEDGQIQTVQYQKLVPMLLNELQKQRYEQQNQAESLQTRVTALQKALETLMAVQGQAAVAPVR